MLRPYQREIVHATLESIKKYNRVVISAPVGAGKTRMAKALIEHFLSENKRIFFVVNRTELIKQTSNTFGLSNVSILKAGSESDFDNAKPIQIVMLQTWNARKDKMTLTSPDVVIWDEWHLGSENGVMAENFFKSYQCKIIGLSATPIDENGCKMDNYDVLIDLYTTKKLQALGFLAKDIWYSSHQNLGLENIEVKHGDYIEKELSRIMNQKPSLHNVIQNFEKLAKDKKTIVFAVDIEHAENLTSQFKAQGYKTECMHSKMNLDSHERQLILTKFKLGEIQILVSVGMLTTGFDETSIECAIFARPTKSLRLFVQMTGRGLRIHDSKTHCLFIDCANNVWEHGLGTDEFDFTIPKGTKTQKKKRYMRQCPDCESANSYTAKHCTFCGFEFIRETIEKKPIKILNDDLILIDLDDVTIHEKGFPDLKHVFELLKIARHRNIKTMQLTDAQVSGYIQSLYKQFSRYYSDDIDFLRELQGFAIKCVRAKKNLFSIRHWFIEIHQPQKKDTELLKKLALIRGEWPEKCYCGGTYKRHDKHGQEVYFCNRCGIGYSREHLEKKYA